MPLNERDVVATVAEVRAAGQITPRALRRAVAARLGLDAKDEAVLIEKYTQCIEDAAAASSDAVAGEEKLAAAPVAASDSDDASYDVRLGMTAAGEEKFDAIEIEASATPFEDDSFASARPADERDVAQVMAAFSVEEDYFASASSDADTPARKSEGRIARAYSISEDEKQCDSVLDKLSDVKQGNLLETIQKPDAIRRPFVDTPVWCAINGLLFVLTQVDDQDSICRLDSYNPATGEWRRMPDPPLQAYGLNFGAVEHAGKLYVIGGNAPRIAGGREEIADVRVFDGQEWSPGPPLPSPAVCYLAVSAGDSILVVFDNFRRAYVLHNGTWHSHSCEETELLAFPMVVPLGAVVVGHIA